MSRRAKKSKYNFILKIDIGKTNQKYNIESHPEELLQENASESSITNTTKLSELNTDKKGTPETISFLDESKRLHTCMVSMIDFNSRMDVNLLRYHCFWDKNPFDTKPIGCPIKYVSSQAVKKYYSQISRDTYTIKENVTSSDQNTVDDDRIFINEGKYYETDGVFCSFNCCKAFIAKHKHMRLYDSSDMLLTKMYNELNSTKSVVIVAAPDWRLLLQYGGPLNIIRFRDGFNKLEYEYHGDVKFPPNFLPIGRIFEEKINF
jgi:hypothetical protein